jgi:valyl-tRNA synthetase
VTSVADPRPENPATDLPTHYDPAGVEETLYQRWLDAGYFRADEQKVLSGERTPFSIVLPPPNVTGNLHVGHALDHTLMDILSRWHRMSGDEVLWLPGMDHAGIATQTRVERELAKEGKTRFDLGREKFVERVWQWKEASGGAIGSQMKRLGDSVDWSRERFTFDEGLSAAVQTIFKKLYDEGLIYRDKRITNWCPGCMTALSDIEVEHRDDEGELVSLRYDGPDFSVVVATTRVETMLGDTAVAVHPDDERYTNLVGRTVTLPLVGREIPIVADAHVDPAFGTGAVKVTPAHDPNDFDIATRHQLPAIDILTPDGRITGTGTAFDGLDRFEARAAVKAALAQAGHVVGEKKPYVHAVGHCSRSDDAIEPRLSLQWFVKVAPLAKAAGDAVRDGRTRIHPQELAARYFEWVDDMHDWTISRQLWWGHRIPVWYGPVGEMVCVGPGEAPPVGEGWHQDEDVLDTWFSSALWPFSTMGWPEATDTLRAFYPTSVLVTGYDILFFWVARMMMMGLEAMSGNEKGDQPFDVVALHGLVRDEHGKKMSKSKGNVVDPLEWIDRFGADAVRFTLARGANPGTDQAIAEDWVRGSKSFCSKLHNATRFALMNGATVPDEPIDRAVSSAADRWILGRLDDVIAATTTLLGDFQFAKAAEGLYHFAWDEVCDWYLELAKAPLYDGGVEAEHTRAVLGTVLDALLKLLHPFVPFVTESLWTSLTGGESLVIAPWPVASGAAPDDAAATEIADVMKLVTELRRFRADQGLAPGKRVPATIAGAEAAPGVVAATRSVVRLTEPAEAFSATASVEVALSFGIVAVNIDTSETIDVAAEKARLDKDLAAARQELDLAERKLGNPAFTGKAPEQVVAGIRARRDTAAADIARITDRLAALNGGSGATGV